MDPTAARRETRVGADEALRLQPDLPEGHLALGFSVSYGDRDYKRALAEFEIAERRLPNEAKALSGYQRHCDGVRGNGPKSTANLEKRALDPEARERR